METKMVLHTAPSVEQILGSREKRYCSNGFRNVQFALSSFQLHNNGLHCNVSVEYAKEWSVKKDIKLKPHLGTAEYIAISILVSEFFLREQDGLSSEDISFSWIDFVQLKAFPFHDRESVKSVRLDIKERVKHTDNTYRTSFIIRVGHMQIVLNIIHPLKNTKVGSKLKRIVCLDYIDNNFYKSGYKEVEHDILHVKTDLSSMKTEAEIHTIAARKMISGIGSSYYPCMDILSFILISGQLIQVLLYGLDDLTRNETSNLWLRNLKIRNSKPTFSSVHKETVMCKTFKKVTNKNGIWRVADICLSMGNMEASFNIAHQLNNQNEIKNSNRRRSKISQAIISNGNISCHNYSISGS